MLRPLSPAKAGVLLSLCNDPNKVQVVSCEVDDVMQPKDELCPEQVKAVLGAPLSDEYADTAFYEWRNEVLGNDLCSVLADVRLVIYRAYADSRAEERFSFTLRVNDTAFYFTH